MPHTGTDYLPSGETLVQRILARKRMSLIVGGRRAGKRTMRQEMARQHALRQKIALSSPIPAPIASIRYACMSPTEHETLDNHVHQQVIKQLVGEMTLEQAEFYRLVEDEFARRRQGR